MKLFFLPAALSLALLVGIAQAGDPSPAPSPSSPPAALAGPEVQPPLVAGVVAVAEPAAPPKWAEDVIVAAGKLPVLGPIVSKLMLYGGILAALLTSLVAFLMGAIKLLQGVFNLAGLASAVAALDKFQNGRFMYYLKYFSNINVQKPSPPKAA